MQLRKLEVMSTRRTRRLRGRHRISNGTCVHEVVQPCLYRFSANGFKLLCCFGRGGGSLINSRGKAEDGETAYHGMVRVVGDGEGRTCREMKHHYVGSRVAGFAPIRKQARKQPARRFQFHA